MRIGVSTRIRICNGDTAPRLTRRFEREWTTRPIGIPGAHVFVRVAMRPAIHRDRLDVSCRIEASTTQGTCEQTADLALKRLERVSGEQSPTIENLLALGTPLRAAQHHLRQMQQNGIGGILRESVAAHAYRKVDACLRPESTRRFETVNAELFE